MLNIDKVNAAIFNWDQYLLYGKFEKLSLAHKLMKEYRAEGGELYKETEMAIASAKAQEDAIHEEAERHKR